MVGVVADYKVISDEVGWVQLGKDKIYTFNLSDRDKSRMSYVRDKSILQFCVEGRVPCFPKDSNGGLSIFFNGQDILARVKSRYAKKIMLPEGTFMRTSLHEMFPASLLRAGENEIKFSYGSGEGGVQVSDIVVWFQARAE